MLLNKRFNIDIVICPRAVVLFIWRTTLAETGSFTVNNPFQFVKKQTWNVMSKVLIQQDVQRKNVVNNVDKSILFDKKS